MAIDLHHSPIEVRLIQPGPIDTDIWDRPGEERAVYDGPKEPPEVVAEGLMAAIEGDGFEHYLPDLKPFVDAKQADIDGYLAGVAAMIQDGAMIKSRPLIKTGMENNMKALLFGVEPDKWTPPPEAESNQLLANLAVTPMRRWTSPTPGRCGPTGWSPGPAWWGSAARTPSRRCWISARRTSTMPWSGCARSRR